ncbi:MAG: hypothetical protein ACYTEZ_18600 [Planctomycetota bacterium]
MGRAAAHRLRLVLLLVLAAPSLKAEERARDEVDRLVKLAQRCEERGQTGHAERHLEEALALAPDSLRILKALLALNRDDPQGFALWSLFLAARATDARGRLARPGGFPLALWRRLEPTLALAPVRAAVVERLAAEAKRLRKPEAAPLAHYLHDVARTCMDSAPALRTRHAPVFAAAVARCQPDPAAVLARLERAMLGLLSAGREDDALRAARILRGATVQARRTKLAVRRRETLHQSAGKVIAKIRRKRRARVEPLGVEDVRRIPRAQRPGWQVLHRDWANPTVVISPEGRYRIESVCGVRTTLMAAADVEYQHRRLVAWYGRDPFEQAQGTVRLCRSPADLEREGQPHYWAGGFQAGHVTALVVNASNRQGIATGLTHELTHRFDGALYPRLPAWLLEGRAVYTAGATLWPRAERIEARSVLWGSIYRTMIRGFRSAANLSKLIDGTLEDYRDNYAAGYTLWLYLTRFRQDRFGARIEPYLRSFATRPGSEPLARFERFFVDGKQGRPGTFADLVKDWSRFVGEGAAIDPVAWKKEWNARAGAARKEARERQARLQREAQGLELASPRDRSILDHSNWPRIRSRSDDPAFGERHAYAAALWFEAHDKTAAARDAFVWARQVDELDAARLRRIAGFHEARGQPASAWLLRLAARGRTHEPVALGAPPARVAAVQALLTPLLAALKEREAAARAAGQPRTARALLFERVRLARRAGLEPGPVADAAPPRDADLVTPDCGPYLGVLAAGIVEDYWAPAESWQRGNYFVDPAGLLVLGRKSLPEALTGYKRDAGVRRVFVRGEEWFSGTYTVRARVRFISAHLNASVVVGHTRHDRGLGVSLGGGDWAYAVGRKKEGRGFRGIRVSLNDLRSYDGGVGRLRTHVTFGAPRTSCLLTIRVSGPFVRVRIDGREVLSHRTTTGIPLDGRVGFYLGSGLVAFEKPEIARHRALGPDATCPCEAADAPIDLGQPCSLPWETLPGRRLLGVPRDAGGAVLLCYTPVQDGAWRDADAAAATVAIWQQILGEAPAAARLRVALPGAQDGETKTPFPWGGVLDRAAVLAHAGLATARVAQGRWLAEEAARRAKRRKDLTPEEARAEVAAEARLRPPWLTVDPRGVVRAAGLWIERWHDGPHKTLVHRLRGW